MAIYMLCIAPSGFLALKSYGSTELSFINGWSYMREITLTPHIVIHVWLSDMTTKPRLMTIQAEGELMKVFLILPQIDISTGIMDTQLIHWDCFCRHKTATWGLDLIFMTDNYERNEKQHQIEALFLFWSYSCSRVLMESPKTSFGKIFNFSMKDGFSFRRYCIE